MVSEDLVLKLNQYFSPGMTPFQMEYFVVEDFQTPYRKIRQAVVEIRSRVENKQAIEFDIEEADIKILQIDDKILYAIDDYETRLLKVDQNRLKFQIERKKAIINQINFEISSFISFLEQIAVAEYGSIDELMKNLTDVNFHIEQEKNYWTKKLSRSVASDLINFGTVTKGVIESVQNLPISQQTNILNSAMDSNLKFLSNLNLAKDTSLLALDR